MVTVILSLLFILFCSCCALFIMTTTHKIIDDESVEIKTMPADVMEAILQMAQCKQRFDRADTATDLIRYGKQVDRAVVTLLNVITVGADSNSSVEKSNVVEVDFRS